jgi:hypothetical protein
MGGSAIPAASSRARHEPPARCVSAWNGPANAAARAAATPPRGPYPWFAHRPIRPQGGFAAFVGHILTVGGPVGTHPAPCAVYFWFPHGYRGRPALLSFNEVDLPRGVYGRPAINARRTMRFHPTRPVYTEGRDGLYGDPSVTVGNDTDVGGRIYVEAPDGRLRPTGRYRRA